MDRSGDRRGSIFGLLTERRSAFKREPPKRSVERLKDYETSNAADYGATPRGRSFGAWCPRP